MQRSLIACALSGEECLIANPSFSDDCLAVLDALEDMGIAIHARDEGIVLNGKLSAPIADLNAGESGLGARLLIPLACLFDSKTEIGGRGSLLTRPMFEFVSALSSLGATVTFPDEPGFLPIRVRGPLHPAEIRLDGSQSSQFLSGLLMVLPLLQGDSSIHLTGAVSKPYIDLTLEVMDYFGVHVIHRDYIEFRVPGNQRYQACSIFIDGDWSAGATMLAAGAVAGGSDFRIEECGGPFSHADQRITGALLFAGCRLERDNDNYRLRKGRLRGFEFDATDSPDLFPPLVALAAFCEGKSTLKGAGRLKHKESDRAVALQEELGKLGVHMELDGDVIIVKPQVEKYHFADVDARGDHRIAMAAAIVALGAKGARIHGAECVKKSYPDFWKDLKSLGADIEG
jgi:3-phosphoshikimate 1-carboxyvinyltransferase